MNTTIITGLAIFILSQFILEFILKPLKEYKDIKNEIFNKLKYYSNIITNPTNLDNFITRKGILYQIESDDSTEYEFNKLNKQRIFENYLRVSDEIRKLSCDLEVKFFYNFCLTRKLFIGENSNNIDEAVSSLIRISNSLFDVSRNDSNSNDIDKIRNYLNYYKK